MFIDQQTQNSSEQPTPQGPLPFDDKQEELKYQTLLSYVQESDFEAI